MATSVKLGVDVSAFKSGIKDAQANVKALGAELKRNEAQFKATGNAEQYLTDKTRLLKMQMTAQKNEINNLEQALSKMRSAGVVPTSAAYQNMQRQLAEAQTNLLNMSVELNNVATSEQNAAKGADQLASSVSGISKKMSLDQVLTGINKITGGLEKAAKKAVEVGKAIWDNITDSARLADDTATAAMMLDMTVEQYQQYKGVFDTIAEMTVQDWKKAEQKVRKAIYDPSQEQIDVLAALGIKTHGTVDTGFGMAEGLAKDWETVFWEAAQKLQSKVKSGAITQDQADTWGEALFGKNFSSLKGLIGLGKEGFAAALEEQAAASAEAIEKDAKLNDTLIKLQASYEALKLEVTSGLAPALTAAAETLDSLLMEVLDYLHTPEGQQALKDMETAVSGLFEDLGKIDPEKVVEGFTKVFGEIVGSLQWMVDNEGTLKGILGGIVGTWGTLKLTGGVLEVKKLIDGIMGLSSAGSQEAAAAAGSAAGAAWGGAFATAVTMAAPWLIALWAAKATPEENKLGSEQRVEAATYTQDEIDRLRTWVNLQNELTKETEKYGTIDFDENKYNSLVSAIEQLGKVQEGDLWGRYWDYLMANDVMPGYGIMPTDFLDKMSEQLKSEEPVEVPVELVPAGDGESVFGEDMQQRLEKEAAKLGNGKASGMLEGLVGIQTITINPKPEDNAAEKIAQDVGVVQVPAELIPFGGRWINPSFIGGAGGGGGGKFGDLEFHANGLPMVPWDGYPAILHKDEQVVPAREVNNSRNFSSNLYVENMNMNGASAEGLAATMAAAQRRMMRGYGS